MRNKLILLSPLLLVLLLFIAQPGQSQSPEVEVADEMADVPTNCGTLAESMAIDPMIPQAIGMWPIWFALPNVQDETRGILYFPNQHYHTHPDLEGWWATKAAWFIPLSYTGEVKLQGVNIADNSPMYIDAGEMGLNLIATLNPAQPGGFIEGLDDWAFFPSYAWVSKAGCYRLQAEWDGGRWEQIIAVGNVE
jgi:hypothetical protein